MRLHAVALALPFERPRLTAIDARLSLQQSDFGGDDPADAFIAAIERHSMAAARRYIPAPEITPPEPTPARHAPRPPTIDGDSVQHGCDKTAETGGNPGFSDGYADRESATANPSHGKILDLRRLRSLCEK
jgi:hypothetical protein